MHAPQPIVSVAPCRARGFTLVELLTVVVIIGIIALIAVPSFANLIATIRLSTTTSDLWTALSAARSEATKRNVNVTLTRKGSSWSSGWSITDPDDSSKVLLDRNRIDGGTVTGSLNSVVYQSSGRVQGATKPTFTVTMTSGSASMTKYVCVDLSGRPFVSESTCP